MSDNFPTIGYEMIELDENIKQMLEENPFENGNLIIEQLEEKPLKIKYCIDVIKFYKDNDYYGPYCCLSYIFKIVNEFLKERGKKLHLIDNTCADSLSPYPINYQPKNKENFTDERNFKFIIKFVKTSKFNILPWSYVYIFDERLNDIRRTYVREPFSSGFSKSLSIICKQKLDVTDKKQLQNEVIGFTNLYMNLFTEGCIRKDRENIPQELIKQPCFDIILNGINIIRNSVAQSIVPC